MGKRFAFDINKCTGCHSCILACNIENERDGEINWRQVFTFNNFHHPALPLFHISMACNQCNSPSCLKYCPANAFSKDLTTGAVNINPDLCIGCKYCNWTCPFDATKFSTSKNIMEKCDFCNHKLAENLPPVCVNLCPTGALGLENNSNIPNFIFKKSNLFSPFNSGKFFYSGIKAINSFAKLMMFP